MRTIQEIFNAVIDEGFYSIIPIFNGTSWCMCAALRHAYIAERITEAERHKAMEAINEYLQEYAFLRSALRDSGLPDKFEDRLAIYRDWANRPQLNIGTES